MKLYFESLQLFELLVLGERLMLHYLLSFVQLIMQIQLHLMQLLQYHLQVIQRHLLHFLQLFLQLVL